MNKILGNVDKIDFLMSFNRDSGYVGRQVHYRYLLCSTPRCGSNLVSDMLQQTKAAGDPMECFNARYIAGYLREKSATSSNFDIDNYITEIEQRRATDNGYFGIKMHYEHLQSVINNYKFDGTTLLKSFNRVILLRRKNKVAQAVSLYRARKTQIWSSLDYQFLALDDPRLQVKVAYNSVAISRTLADIIQQEYSWISVLKSNNIPFETIWYEDFVSNYQEISKRLLNWLDLNDKHANTLAPSLKKQGDSTDLFLDEFVKELGIVDGQ